VDLSVGTPNLGHPAQISYPLHGAFSLKERLGHAGKRVTGLVLKAESD